MITQTQLASMVGPERAARHHAALTAGMSEFFINTPARVAGFLAHVLHETQGLTALSENLKYSDPTRIVKIFRTAFDLDKDKVVDPEEIAFAKGYVLQPQKLANRAYANRFGNGDEASGDGWRYRGQGYMHTTFQANYLKVGKMIGEDLVKQPELLSTDLVVAARAAAAQWAAEGCNRKMDLGDFEATIKAINPGMAGAEERRTYFKRLSTILR